jgi:hypothetical protein
MSRYIEISAFLVAIICCVGLTGYAFYAIPKHKEWVTQCEAKGGVVIRMRTESKCLDVKELKI